MGEVLLRDIIERLGGELVGDPATRIESIEPLESAGRAAISFLSNPIYDKQLASSGAGCVIVAPAFRDAAAARGAAIVTPDPYLYFARLTQWWAERTQPLPAPTIDPSAAIDRAARLGARVAVGAFAVIEAGAVIGDDARIGAHTIVGAGSSVGAATRIGPRVVLATRTSIGARGIVHPGGDSVQVVLGPIADQVAGEIRAAASAGRATARPDIAAAIADALRRAGIRSVSTCGSRLLVDLEDMTRISAPTLDALQTRGWLAVGDGVQIIIGPGAEAVAEALSARAR